VADLSAPEMLDRIERVTRSLSVGNSNASVQVELNAGGLGVIVAAGCCVLMLVLSGVLLWVVGDMRSSAEQAAIETRAQLREHGHQLNAIYRVAPSVEREVRARLEEDARLRAQASE
jgi:hypothetical protein